MRRYSMRQVQKKNGMKKKADEDVITIDLSELDSENFDASKHRSCWMHMQCKLTTQKTSTSEDQGELDLFKRISPCFYGTYPSHTRSSRGDENQVSAAKLMGKLDTRTFSRCLENLWGTLSEDKKALFTYLDCLWFNMYSAENHRTKVLTWIMDRADFSKTYVIVPIVMWDHWNLLILCHFNKSLESCARKPCMLLLDSLANAGPRRYEPTIRKFVFDILQALGRPETKKLVSKMPFMLPKVPQQMDNEECGKFVLYFIHLFVNAAPEDFNVSNGYPYFMTENWFDREGYEIFCKQLSTTS